MLENQNNLVREVQESISSLNSIIKNTREEIMATTNSNQLLMTENMRNLTKALEIVKDNMMSRVGSLDNAMVDLNKRMELTNEAFNENTIKVTQAMENEFNRVDRVMNRFEDLMTESNKQLNDRISEGERKQQAWRSEYEDKNHNIFKEMSTALKSLKKQIMKVNKDSDDRDQELGKLIEDAKKLADGMFKNLDEKANHLENVYNFKLDESTKVWEHNLQIEVDKVLDAISKNTEAVQTDLVKRMANLKLEVNKTMFDNVDKEVFNLRELVSETRRVIEDSTISKLRDIEVRLENLFRVRFDEYRIKLEDSIREFNRLKGEMEHIKKDYYNSLETVREDMKANTRREVETMKGQLVNRIKESKDQVDELMASTVKLIKEDIDLNKLDMQRSVGAAKLHIQSELQTSVNDIKNMVDKNDQIIHADVNNKMNSLNTEISTQKKFLMERMDEMHESTKSLARALVAEEAANRANQDEMIIKLFDRKIGNLNAFITDQVEQKLEHLKVDLENKIKDALLGLEEFKRWTLDQFSKVRTEHEYFKQEYYARDYADHLMFLTFEAQVRAAFDGCQNQFHEARRAIDSLRGEMEDANKQIKKNIEEEQKNREDADEKMDKKFADYKKLNEKTWEEMLMMYQTDLYNLRLNLSIVEEAIYESIRRVIASLGSLGGASDDLLKKIEDTSSLLGKHMDKTKKQDKTNADTFKEVKDTAAKFREDYDGFKKVTKRNFEVTEESLSVLSHYMNSLDSQMNIDQMMSLATFNLLEQRSAAGVAEVEGLVRIINNDTVDKLEDKLKKQEKKIVEDIIPGQILKVNESLNKLGQTSNENTTKLTETLQKKITEHALSIEKHEKDITDHAKQLQEHAQRIKFAEENLTDAGEDFKKIERTIADTNAQVVVDAIAIQADINVLKTGMVETIKEIYSTLASMEAGDKGEAEATTSSMAKVTKRLDTIDKKMAELDKATIKYDDRIKKVEAVKDKGKDEPSAKKDDVSATSKEIDDLKKEIENLVADVKELKAAGKGKGKDKDNSKDADDEEASNKSSNSDKLPQQVAQLQSQVKALEKKMEALGNGNKDDDNDDNEDDDGEDDDEEKSEKKTKKKGKKDKRKAKKDDDDEDSGDDSTKVTQGDLDDLESKIDKKLEKLKDEFQELIDGKDKNKSDDDEDEEKSKTNKKKKGKDDDEDDEKSEGNDVGDLKEKLEQLETRVAELEEKKNESGDDDEKDDNKKSGNDEDLDEKINEKVEEKIKEMRDDLKEEILNEIKENKDEDSEKKDDDDDDDDDKGKRGGNSEIWKKIDKMEEKFDEYDQVKLTVDRLEKDVERLKVNDDDEDEN